MSDYANPAFYSDQARRDHTPRVRSMIRNCHIVARAQRAAMDMPSIQVRSVRGRVLFVIGGQVCVSFKKLDRRLRSHNIPTQQTRDFLRQHALWSDGELPPQLTNLVAGYQADLTETGFDVWVTCPCDDVNQWELQLSNSDLVELFPAGYAAAPSEEAFEPVRRRVQLRPGVIKKNGSEQSAG